MSEELQDDAVIVNDEEQQEKSHEELVAKVAKRVGRDEWGDSTEETPGDTPEETNETPSEETPDETPALSDVLQARAEKAGLDKELAERLHQSGQLEATLAAFDRTMVERFQALPEKEIEPKEPIVTEDELPELDPEIYDEDIVKRDRYYKQRMDQQQELIDQLLQDRQEAFDSWFDEVLTEMGYDINDTEKCQKTFKAYKGLCEANDVSPEKRDKSLAERAHAAMFPEDVKRKTQKETVDRLRDAEGKFLNTSKPKGPPPQKHLTEEDNHDQLVANVASYLKKQGVKMSGY